MIAEHSCYLLRVARIHWATRKILRPFQSHPQRRQHCVCSMKDKEYITNCGASPGMLEFAFGETK
jgi:hypothetical protein